MNVLCRFRCRLAGLRVAAWGAWVLLGFFAADAGFSADNTAADEADVVLCRGAGVEVRRRDLDTAYLQFRAGEAARGEGSSARGGPELEAQLLDRLVITRLLVNRATASDRAQAQTNAVKYVTQVREQAGSESAYRRQLLIMGFKPEEFETQLRERFTCDAVVDRELRGKVTIGDAEVRRYYDEHADQLRRPEMYQFRHLTLVTCDPATGAALPAAEREAKRQRLEELARRARAGEDFAKLAQTYSENPETRAKGGELIIAKGGLPPELEAVLAALSPGQISDVVSTADGHHLLLLIRKIPSEPIEFDRIREELREKLVRDAMERQLLPEFQKRIKAEAKLVYLNGARPPKEQPPLAP